MELSGEVLSGYFFKEIPGPQFISPGAFRVLRQGNQHESVFWLNATDPISPCGLGLQVKGQDLPRRLSSNHLVFHGEDLVLVSTRKGRSLTFHVAADDKELPSYVEVLRHLLYRSFQGLQKIEIEMINGLSSRQSPYLDALETSFNLIRDHKSVYLQREI
jgi:ATP-dependent Lhr-like helicase